MRLFVRLTGTVVLLGALCLSAVSLSARPLLSSSEESAGQLCLRDEDTPERMLLYCRAALAEEGATDETRSEYHRNLGSADQDLGDIEAATESFLAAVDLDPGSVEALNLLAWNYWDLDREPEAMVLFRRSSQMRPTASAYGGMANILRRIEQRPEEALESIEIALALLPDYRWGLREKGWILFDLDQDEDALATFQEAVYADGDNASAHWGIMTYHQRKGDYETALLSANRTMEIAPEDAFYRARRAFILRRLDRNQQAILDASRAIELDPLRSNGYAQKAFAEIALGYTARALSTFEEAVEAGAGDNFLLYWYADHLSEMGRMEEAMLQIDAAIAEPDTDSADQTLKAYIALELDRDETALEAAEAALAEDAEDEYALYYKAVADLRMGRAEEAIAGFDAAMAADLPENYVSRFVAELVFEGKVATALKLRLKY